MKAWSQCLPDGYIQLVLLNDYFPHSIIILVFTVFAPSELSQFRPCPVLGHHPFLRLPLTLGEIRILGGILYGQITTFECYWSYQFLRSWVERITAWYETLSTFTLNIYPRWTYAVMHCLYEWKTEKTDLFTLSIFQRSSKQTCSDKTDLIDSTAKYKTKLNKVCRNSKTWKEIREKI